MPELDDQQLLREFAETHSETAFAALVARYINLVHSAALRHCGDAHHAEEITQAVFIILARKAGSLREKVVLPGWLYQTARLTAANVVRSEASRQRREQEAYMQSTLNEPDPNAWSRIAPMLDDAMGRLGEIDRNAVALHFFENKTAREVAAALNLTEAAAHKRLNRALEKLRKIFGKRGVTLAATAIAGAISAHSVQAAPVGLAKSVTFAAVAKGATVSSSTLTLIKGALKMMAWAKAKTAMAVAVGMVLCVGAGVALVDTTVRGDREARQILERSLARYAALKTYRASGSTTEQSGNGDGVQANGSFDLCLGRPDLYRLEYELTTSFFTNQANVWSDGSGHYFKNLRTDSPATAPDGKTAARESRSPFQGMTALQQNLGSIADVSGGVAAMVPSMFYGIEIPPPVNNAWNAFTRSRGLHWHPVRESDAAVGGVECFVLSITTGEAAAPGKAWLWIGKQDYLVHQSREQIDFRLPAATDQEVADWLNQMKRAGRVTLTAAELKRRLNDGRKRASATMQPVTISFDLPKGQNGINSITVSPPGFRLRTQTYTNIVLDEKFASPDFKP
ncbi:MAG TPA: sigma-70 family RNA polymerase sigma factor [Verrucomicrobiae bacterium]